MCLECGGRMEVDYRRPAGWKLPVAIVGVVLLAAGVGFAAGLHRIGNESDEEVANTPPGNAAVRGNNAGQRGARTGPTTQSRNAVPGRAVAPGIPTWPTGRDGFTVVLLSSSDRASAAGFARTAKQGGTRIGALRSSDYSSLQKGFWLVFSGVYRTRPQAERAAQSLSRGFPGAFSQFVNGAKRR
jgi:sporulation related protein